MGCRDRAEAGRRLASRLEHLRGEDLVVVGLPRGGVPVAFEVALALGAPLEVVVVRKLGLPLQPELGMGAIGEAGAEVLNGEVLRMARVRDAELAAVERRERAELEGRAGRLRGGLPPLPLRGRTAVVVDDGVATGSTARVACQVVRSRGARRVVLGVPVAPRSSLPALEGAADELVCLEEAGPFFAVGQWYEDFHQVSDEEVMALLRRAAALEAGRLPPSPPPLPPPGPPPG